jgi:hypothetical protein
MANYVNLDNIGNGENPLPFDDDADDQFPEAIDAIGNVGEQFANGPVNFRPDPYAFTRSNLRSLYFGLLNSPMGGVGFDALRESVGTPEFLEQTAPLLLLWSNLQNCEAFDDFQDGPISELLEPFRGEISEELFEEFRALDPVEFLGRMEQLPQLKHDLLALRTEEGGEVFAAALNDVGAHMNRLAEEENPLYTYVKLFFSILGLVA